MNLVQVVLSVDLVLKVLRVLVVMPVLLEYLDQPELRGRKERRERPAIKESKSVNI